MYRMSRSVARSAVSTRHSPTMIVETLSGSLNAGGDRAWDTNKNRTKFWLRFKRYVSLVCFLGRQKLPDGSS